MLAPRTALLVLVFAAVGCAPEEVQLARGSGPTASSSAADGGRSVDGGRPDDGGRPAVAGEPARGGARMGLQPLNDPTGPAKFDDTGPDNPAGLSAAEVTALKAGGPVGDLKWLYPYEGTVFPRGTLAPALMWNGNAATDAVYLRIQSKEFEYQTVLRPSETPGLWLPFGGSDTSNVDPSVAALGAAAVGFGAQLTGVRPTQLLIPQGIWEAAGTRSLGRDDVFRVELTERAQGTIRGPIATNIHIARATLKGSIYYSSCLSAIQGENAVENFFSGAKVLRIKGGSKAQLVLSDPATVDSRCQGCHSVSADGSHLIAQSSNLGESFVGVIGGDFSKLLDALAMRGLDLVGQGLSYQLDPNGTPSSFAGTPIGPNAAYGALYPDGSKYLALSGSIDVGLFLMWGNPASILLPPSAALYDAQTGAVVADTGIPGTATMPMFSPDGRYLVFNDTARDAAHSLVVMDYDTTGHKAARPRVIAREDPQGEMRPGWPAFLPDNRGVIFQRTDDPYFSGSGSSSVFAAPAQNVSGVDVFGGSQLYTSDLYIADLTSGTVSLLARAMGFASADHAARGETYLPFGPADLHRNFFPTVSPAAAGGYFWVFFDSYRNYGSLGVSRQLWGFAVDIRADGSYVTDPSHPPFYLPGQEFGSSNHRAFAALDKCRPLGERCATGIDCCGGACSSTNDVGPDSVAVAGVCEDRPPNTCAKLDERCSSDADCCDKVNHTCINNHCAFVPLL